MVWPKPEQPDHLLRLALQALIVVRMLNICCQVLVNNTLLHKEAVVLVD